MFVSGDRELFRVTVVLLYVLHSFKFTVFQRNEKRGMFPGQNIFVYTFVERVWISPHLLWLATVAFKPGITQTQKQAWLRTSEIACTCMFEPDICQTQL